MKFQDKILFGVMTVAGISVAVGAFATYGVLSYRTERDFLFQYKTKLEIIAHSLQEFERQADTIAQNAVKALNEIESAKGLPSDSDLPSIARNLNISNIFITDRKGRFIRSTNGDPKSFKNGLFDYCAGYRGLVDGSSVIEQTPIIPSSDEVAPGPFKYTMFPNKTRSRILEVSVHLGYITKALSDFVRADPGVLKVGLYTPTGDSLGTIGAKDFAVSREPVKLTPQEIGHETVSKHSDSYVFNHPVSASIGQCCECQVKGVVRPGEDYFYMLRADISNAPLVKAKSDLLIVIAGAGTLILAIAYLLARRLSRSLSRRVNLIESAISRIIQTKKLSERLNIAGSDELSKMGQHFDRLLEALESAQALALKNQTSAVTYKVAQDVAHNIKGPIAALEALLQMSPELAEHRRKVIQDCIRDVRQIADKLLERPYTNVLSTAELPKEPEARSLADLVDEVVTQKKAQYSEFSGLRTVIEGRVALKGVSSQIPECEVKGIISNFIDNAVQASSVRSKPEVIVELRMCDSKPALEVHDNGEGFDEAILSNPGVRGLTTRPNVGGKGIGLAHAFELADNHGDCVHLGRSSLTGGAVVRFEFSGSV